jgi:hypothetical protein
MPSSRKCSQTTLDGRPCQAWAVRGSDPPACAVHAGSRPSDPPPDALPVSHRPDVDAGGMSAGSIASLINRAGIEAALDTVAGTDIGAVIADLAAKQQRLSRYIDDRLAAGDTSVQDMARLLALHSQNASRLGRLLRDQQALGGEAAYSLQHIIDLALDGLAEEWGIEL